MFVFVLFFDRSQIINELECALVMYLQCFSSDTQRRYRTEDIRLVSSNESAVPRLCMFCEIYLKCNINANLCCICVVSTFIL